MEDEIPIPRGILYGRRTWTFRFFAFLFLIPVAKLIISILRGLRGITVEERGRLVLNLKRDKIRNLRGEGEIKFRDIPYEMKVNLLNRKVTFLQCLFHKIIDRNEGIGIFKEINFEIYAATGPGKVSRRGVEFVSRDEKFHRASCLLMEASLKYLFILTRPNLVQGSISEGQIAGKNRTISSLLV